MMPLSVTWDVSPVALVFFGHEVRWYGLCWAVVFLIGYYLVSRRFRQENLPDEWVDKLFIYTILASIIGARLGHCLFYDWDYYSQHPAEILAIWKGLRRSWSIPARSRRRASGGSSTAWCRPSGSAAPASAWAT